MLQRPLKPRRHTTWGAQKVSTRPPLYAANVFPLPLHRDRFYFHLLIMSLRLTYEPSNPWLTNEERSDGRWKAALIGHERARCPSSIRTQLNVLEVCWKDANVSCFMAAGRKGGGSWIWRLEDENSNWQADVCSGRQQQSDDDDDDEICQLQLEKWQKLSI